MRNGLKSAAPPTTLAQRWDGWAGKDSGDCPAPLSDRLPAPLFSKWVRAGKEERDGTRMGEKREK